MLGSPWQTQTQDGPSAQMTISASQFKQRHWMLVVVIAGDWHLLPQSIKLENQKIQGFELSPPYQDIWKNKKCSKSGLSVWFVDGKIHFGWFLTEAYCQDEMDLSRRPGSPDFVTESWMCITFLTKHATLLKIISFHSFLDYDFGTGLMEMLLLTVGSF